MLENMATISSVNVFLGNLSAISRAFSRCSWASAFALSKHFFSFKRVIIFSGTPFSEA